MPKSSSARMISLDGTPRKNGVTAGLVSSSTVPMPAAKAADDCSTTSPMTRPSARRWNRRYYPAERWRSRGRFCRAGSLRMLCLGRWIDHFAALDRGSHLGRHRNPRVAEYVDLISPVRITEDQPFDWARAPLGVSMTATSRSGCTTTPSLALPMAAAETPDALISIPPPLAVSPSTTCLLVTMCA